MQPGNLTCVSEFVFLGLSQTHELHLFLFLVFLLVYTTTVMGNLLIMVTVTSDSRLHTPMYFLLRNLAVIDLCFSSVTAPKMLVDFLAEKKSISYQGCMTQIFFFHFLGGAMVFFLSVMAYDRLGCCILAPPLCCHHDHSALCGAACDSLDGRFCSFHLPTGSDAPTAFLWPQCPK